MSSTRKKIAPSEWERHKTGILELYSRKPLKDVRAEMQNQHGFTASPWQYEMQLKRWNIRKNATRDEWRQYFSTTRDQSVPTSLDVPVRTFSTVILNKSTTSKKRASRWAPGSLVEPRANRAFGSTPPPNEAQPVAASASIEPTAARPNTLPDVQDLFMNVADALHGIQSIPMTGGPPTSNMLDLDHLHWSPQQDYFASTSEIARLSPPGLTPLHAVSFPAAQSSQSPVPGQDSSDRALFASLGIPAENNLIFFNVLKGAGFKRELPSAQLEHNLRSKGIFLDRASGRAILAGFAVRFVAEVLSSNDQPMARRTPNLQHFLHKLSSQVPGESSALITDDQAFETKFVRVLLFSMLNGFAGLNDIPIENILRFLNCFVVNKLLLDILDQCPQHVSRTLADNIFRAAIEATDTKIVDLLLSREFVHVNETVCFHKSWRYTPIERAAANMSLRLTKTLIDAGADVNKSHASFKQESAGGALGALRSEIKMSAYRPRRSETQVKLSEIFHALVAAGARVYPELIITGAYGETAEFDTLILQNVLPDSHRDFFKIKPDSLPLGWPLARAIHHIDDCLATSLVRHVISLCHQAGCNKCLFDFRYQLRDLVISAAKHGKVELSRYLFDKVDLKSRLPDIFIAAIKSQSHSLIEFILSHGPELDPPAVKIGHHTLETPLSEAVRYSNDHLIRKLEAEGCFDHLNEGYRLQALFSAAVKGENMAVLKKIVARAVTSKQAYRVKWETLAPAIQQGHHDIVQMLLEAGATTHMKSSGLDFSWWSISPEATDQMAMQMLHAIIASGATLSDIKNVHGRPDQTRIAVLVQEYPEFRLDQFLVDVLSNCVETDTLDFFKELLQTLQLLDGTLSNCLQKAVELSHGELVGYLLDIGAHPFNDRVLQAVIPDRPDMLRLLFHKERQRQAIPKCVGARILIPIIGHEAGNAEALDELVRTSAINFKRPETLDVQSSSTHTGRQKASRNGTRLTPLGLAIQGIPGRFDTNVTAIKKFLQAGADPNGVSLSCEKWNTGSPLMTALMMAVETGREDVVNMLLDNGADVNARPRIRTTRTALQFAAELGNADMVRLLLSRGADANSLAPFHGGATALQFAAISGNCNMVEELLDHGAELGALPSKIDGMWPLEGAAANGRLDMIRYLWELNVLAVAGGTFPDGFSERHCLRAMNFARENGHIGCRDLISDLCGVSVERLETDEYGAPGIAY